MEGFIGFWTGQASLRKHRKYVENVETMYVSRYLCDSDKHFNSAMCSKLL